MRYILAAVVIALCPAVAVAWPSALAPSAQRPHPAVVRVIVTDRDGASMGSGVLVAVDGRHGLVVTNLHVVRDAAGPDSVTVVFPDGFRSGALILKTDHDWDLAALAIQRPRVQPIPLAPDAARPGDLLTIAGYGPEGVYRAVTGRCTEYLSPGGNLPAEFVEVNVEARRGDSGGPIFNSRGEIAGILFGAGGNMLTGGYTMGSYCGRVRLFLASSYGLFQSLPGNTAMLAQAPAPLPPSPMTATPGATSNRAGIPVANFAAAQTRSLPPSRSLPAGATAESSPPRPFATNFSTSNRSDGSASTPPLPVSPVAQVSPAAASQSDLPASRSDQIKSVLAVIGVIAVLFHGLRIVAAAVG